MVRTAAAYCRLSIREKSEGSSLDGQRDALEGWSRTLEPPVELTFYVDDGYSGTDPNRPEYQRMISAVKSREHSHVVGRSVDRLGRNLRAFTELVDLGDQHDTAIVAVTESLNSKTESGRMMLELLSVFAAAESRAIGTRQRYSQEVRRNQGRWVSGPAPFGLKSVHREDGAYLVLDPERVDVLREMVDRCISGEAFLSIAQWLNDEGHTTTRGKSWNPTTVASTLRNPAIAGLRQTRAEGGEPQLFTDDAGVPIVYADHAAIDLETWRRLQLATEQRRSAAFGRNDSVDREPQLLQGVARCGSCGGPLSRSSNATTRGGERVSYEIYRCARGNGSGCDQPVTMKAEKLNEHVSAYLADRADDEFYEIVREDNAQQVERRHLMQAEIDRIAGDLAGADEAKIPELSQQIARLRQEINAVDVDSAEIYQPSGMTIGGLLAESPRACALQVLETVTVQAPSRPRASEPLTKRVMITPRFDPVADDYLVLSDLDQDAARDWCEETGGE